MNLYSLIRPALFALDPEIAHELTLKGLKIAQQTGLIKLVADQSVNEPVKIMGLTFKNKLGLAAGLDKNGDYIDALSALNFGFIEIGTVTPFPQSGNQKPRLFRLPEYQAIINRMGFNNLGIDHLLEQVKRRRSQSVLGINIGKNASTPMENAADDYLIGLRKGYAVADYITLNISSPNTKNLRQLQQGDDIRSLLDALKKEQQILQRQHQKYTPLVLKIAPDLNPEEIAYIAKLLLEFEIDGVIATNTTLARHKLGGHFLREETGGLSGAPLYESATAVVKLLAVELGGKIPIIAAGGIMSAEDAQNKFKAGASLIQVYTGLIYKGPQLISEILNS
ncbi:MAG: quinone-dependent dihydroorotate dehydrogenase [Methylococcales bacterium]